MRIPTLGTGQLYDARAMRATVHRRRLRRWAWAIGIICLLSREARCRLRAPNSNDTSA